MRRVPQRVINGALSLLADAIKRWSPVFYEIRNGRITITLRDNSSSQVFDWYMWICRDKYTDNSACIYVELIQNSVMRVPLTLRLIVYEYRDPSDGYRVRKYLLNIDLDRATANALLNTLLSSIARST